MAMRACVTWAREGELARTTRAISGPTQGFLFYFSFQTNFSGEYPITAYHLISTFHAGMGTLYLKAREI